MKDLSTRVQLACTTATLICFSAVSASGQATVRDAVGGESAIGSPAFYHPGTGGDVSVSVNFATFSNYIVGAFDFEADFGSGFSPLMTFCVELGSGFLFGENPPDTIGTVYPIITTPSGSPNGISASEEDVLEKLWSGAYANAVTSADSAAAFQVFCWELSFDNTFDLDNGLMRVHPSEAAYTIANQWFTNIDNGTWTDATPLMAIVSPGSDNQDLIYPVPEPASALLLVWGAAALLRRRVI